MKAQISEPPKPQNQTPSGRPLVRPKLNVNTPGDAHEQEADATADKVMRMQTPASPGNPGKPANGRYYDPWRPHVRDPFVTPRGYNRNGEYYDPYRPQDTEPFGPRPKPKAVRPNPYLPQEGLEDEKSKQQISAQRKWNGFPENGDDKTLQGKGEELEAGKTLHRKEKELEEDKLLHRKEDKEEDKTLQRKGKELEEDKTLQRTEGKEIEEDKTLHRKEGKEEEKTLDRKEREGAETQTGGGLDSYVNSLDASGQPLPDASREFFEPRFGHDFSAVKIHNDSVAAKSAQSINALAYTTGNNIVFNEGQYAPGSDSGNRLLAHELTHVVQQQGGASNIQRQVLVNEEKSAEPLQQPVGSAAGSAEVSVAAPVAPAVQAGSSAENALATVNSPAGDTAIGTPTSDASPAGITAAPPQAVAVPGPETGKPAPPETAHPAVTVAGTGAPTTPAAGGNASAPATPAGNASGAASVAPATAVNTAPAPSGAASGSSAAPATPRSANAAPGTQSGAAETAAATNAGQTAAQGEGGAAAQVAPAAVTPQSDPAFNAVTASVQHAAGAKAAHPPAKAKEHEIGAAARGPETEAQGLAQGNQVAKISSQQPGPFNKEAFKAALLQKIAQVTPKNLEEADEFKSNDKVGTIKPALTQQVKKETDQAQGDIAHTAAEAPSTSGIKTKEVTPLKDMAAGPAPQIDGKGAVPKPAPDAAVSTSAEFKSLDDAYARGNITSEQLQQSNEPSFIEADNTKRDSQQNIAGSQPGFRKFEQAELSQAGKQTDAILHKGLGQMQGARVAEFANVAGRQQTGKAGDEAVRAKVIADLEKIYSDSKAQVEGRLRALDARVNSLFDTGALNAKNVFENYVDKAIKDYKKRRYDDGLIGAGRWLKDKFLGLPPEVNQFYVSGRVLYEQEMGKTLDVIAATVEAELVAATKMVAEGKQKVLQYIHDQPAAVQKIAQEQGKSILGDFAKLERTVADKQNEIIDSLASKYTEKLKEIDDRIAKMKEANKGWVDKAMAKVGGVISTINDIRKLLAGLLGKAMSALNAILSHPIKFLGDFINAIGTGLRNFMANIGEHLKNGVFDWLLGVIPGGITLPKTWDLQGIFQLVMQVLGFTWSHIRSMAVALMGEKMVKALETTFDIFMIIIRDGIAGLWTFVMDKIGDLKTMIMDAIMNLLQVEVVQAGIKWLLGLLTPAGAFLKACNAIIDIVKWFINNGSRLTDLVSGIVDSIADIAAGNLGGATKRVEDSLKRVIPLTIGFLAGVLGIGDLSKRVQEIIHKVTDPINKAIQWLLQKGYEYGKKFLNKILGRKSGEDSPAVKKEKDVTIPHEQFEVEGHDHELFVNEQGEAMVASGTPTRLEKAVAKYPGDHSAIISEGGELKKKSNEIKDTKDTFQKQKLENEAEELEKSIVEGLKKMRYGGEAKGEMEQADVEFTAKRGDEEYIKEYKRQLDLQEKAMNEMEVGKWQYNRARFIAFGRNSAEDTQVSRRDAMIKKMLAYPKQATLALYKEGLLESSDAIQLRNLLRMPESEARDKRILGFAKLIMEDYGSKKLAVLHTLDQVAGGLPTAYGDEKIIFGSSEVNSEIGRQWKDRITIVDEKSRGVVETAHMNVRLILQM